MPQSVLCLLYDPELFLVSPFILSSFPLPITSLVCFKANRQIRVQSGFTGISVFYTTDVVRERRRGRKDVLPSRGDYTSIHLAQIAHGSLSNGGGMAIAKSTTYLCMRFFCICFFLGGRMMRASEGLQVLIQI